MKSINPYLNFNGNCREAVTFYQKCLGGELDLKTFAEFEGKCDFPPEAKNQVMHAQLKTGPIVVMASDTMPGAPFQQGNNVHLTIHCETMDEIQSLFAALGEKGTVVVPLADMFWGDHFGMLTDQFGINWIFVKELGQAG